MADAATEARIQEILKAQRRTVTVLSSLIAVQEAIGWLPPESIPAVADFTGKSVNEVWGVATFYTHFRFEPPGKHMLEICWGPSCQLFKSKRLMEMTEQFTGVKFDDTTPDKQYTLRGLECAGACALAPVGKFDGKLVGRLNEERLKQILAGINGKA
ncbi:MAG: NAD(P)H-dependent oxidoreductase subunit E [Chloroflexi bacterium]|nr:NAD(P)H-dependent oxidoreductase subunit E [Chloroflexota bacterium]